MSNQQDYPDSDTDAWDWDVLEASSLIETSLPSQPPVTQPSIGNAEGTRLDLLHIDPPDHGIDPTIRVRPSLSHSILQKMASVPDQSFPEPWQPALGAPVMIFDGDDAQQWRISHIKKGIGTSVTITHESSVMTVDKGWFLLDTDTGDLVLKRLGFFGDNNAGPARQRGSWTATCKGCLLAGRPVLLAVLGTQ